MVGFTRQLALEYAKKKVRANAIAPDWHLGTKLGPEVEGKITSEEYKRFEAFMEDSVPMGYADKPDNLRGLSRAMPPPISQGRSSLMTAASRHSLS